MKRMGITQRFWGKVILADNGCLEWVGSTNENGYGQIIYGGKMKKAHRIAYELLVGEIPNKLQLDHLCRKRNCVNPDHLEPVTASENNKRGLNPRLAAERQLIKTHCKKGHAYDTQNTYVPVKGNRMCRTCMKLRYKKG